MRVCVYTCVRQGLRVGRHGVRGLGVGAVSPASGWCSEKRRSLARQNLGFRERSPRVRLGRQGQGRR